MHYAWVDCQFTVVGRPAKGCSPKNIVQTRINENTFSCPGFTNSIHPPCKYLPGFPLQFTIPTTTPVNSVANANSANPSQLVSPRMPATAPEKQDEMNFTDARDELWRRLGPYISCADCSAGEAMMDGGGRGETGARTRSRPKWMHMGPSYAVLLEFWLPVFSESLVSSEPPPSTR